MGKLDVGGGKPLAPSPKHSVAAPAPKHVVAPRSWSFPKPSPYRHAAPHRVVSHNAGYGPRPTPRGSGVHAAVRAQPVKSPGHSAAVARLASKLAQQTSARAATKASLLAQQLRQPNVWTPEKLGTAIGAFSVNTAVHSLIRDLGMQTRPGFDIGPQGGLFEPGFPGYDRLPSQPPQGYTFHGVPAERIPIPKFNTSPRWRAGPQAGKPIPRQAQQRALGFTRNPHAPRPGLANPNSSGYGNTSA